VILELIDNMKTTFTQVCSRGSETILAHQRYTRRMLAFSLELIHLC